MPSRMHINFFRNYFKQTAVNSGAIFIQAVGSLLDELVSLHEQKGRLFLLDLEERR